MNDKIIYWAGNVLMVVEVAAVVFLITEWRKAKKKQREATAEPPKEVE